LQSFVAGTDFQVQTFSCESSFKIFHPSSKYSEIPSSPQENLISILFFSASLFELILSSELIIGESFFTKGLQELKKITIKNICEVEKIDTKETSPKYYLSAIDNLKNKGISPNELSENKYRKNDKEIRKIYSIYQSELLRLNSVDFGDLILFCIKIFQKNNNILYG